MPRIQTTPTVKAALLGLRIYVIFMLVIIAVGFARKVYKNSQTQPEAPPAQVEGPR
jgi:hypothetical protein